MICKKRDAGGSEHREGRVFSRWLVGVGFTWMAGGIVLGPYASALLLAGVVAILVGFGIYPTRRRLIGSLLALAFGSWWIIAFQLFGHE